MGKKSGSSTSTKMDPTQSAILKQTWNFAKDVANRPYTAYEGQTIAGFNPTQQAGFDLATSGALGGVGGGLLNEAVGAARSAASYTPAQIGAGGAGPAAQAQAAQINRGDVRDVTGQLGADFMARYQNPFEDQVVNAALSDLDRSRLMALQQGEDAALRVGGYGGSRQGVADSLTNEAALRQAASTAAGLRSQGFTTAAQLGMTDAGRTQDATSQNQQVDFALAGQNAGFDQQTGLYNAQAADQMAQFNAQQAREAELANLSSGQFAANLGLSASSALSGLSDQERQQLYGDAAMLEGVGDRQQQLSQQYLDDAQRRWQEYQDYPLQQLGILQGVQSGMPSMGGTSTTTQKGSALDTVGRVAGTVGSLMAIFSDENIKSGRRPANEDAMLEGLMATPIEHWSYDPAKGGPDDGGVEHTGAMAQTLKKNLGLGNGRMIPVVDAIGVSMGATKALARRVQKLEGKKARRA